MGLQYLSVIIQLIKMSMCNLILTPSVRLSVCPVVCQILIYNYMALLYFKISVFMVFSIFDRCGC